MPPAFTVRFWGVRGSVPAPGPGTRRHGGNTSCVSIRTAAGDWIVLDAGTGVRALGDALLRESATPSAPLHVSLFLTHLHWDHVQGLPFFSPLYSPNVRLAVHAPATLVDVAESTVRRQMLPPAFPVPFDKLSAAIEFHPVALDGVRCAHGDVVVRPVPAHHPGGAVGWRIDTGEGAPVLVYLPDNEIDDQHGANGLRDAWIDSLRGVPLLLHDATYTPDDLPSHRGWGHSSWDEAVRLAVDAGVERLVLFHHHPDRTDAGVDRVVEEARAMAKSLGSPLRVLAASEGLVLHA